MSTVPDRLALFTGGVDHEAWVVDYVDAQGKRRLKTFEKKKDADNFAATARVEVGQGIHVADSASATVSQANELWQATLAASGLERSSIQDYERTMRLHVVPYIGAVRLTALTTPRLRAFTDELREAGRSPAAEEGRMPLPCALRRRGTTECAASCGRRDAPAIRRRRACARGRRCRW